MLKFVYDAHQIFMMLDTCMLWASDGFFADGSGRWLRLYHSSFIITNLHTFRDEVLHKLS